MELVKEKYCRDKTDYPRVENRAKTHGNDKFQDYCCTKRINNGHTLDPKKIQRPARTSQ